MIRRQVTVIGSHEESEFNEAAFELGRHIARSGWTLICGGRTGIMEAASRGASAENGIVIGILPGNDFSDANTYCTAVVASGIGFARNSMNVLSGEVVVALGGRNGTLTELAYAHQYGKPIIVCMFAGGWSTGFVGMVRNGGNKPLVYEARSVEEACGLLDVLLGSGTAIP
jgi:uncharacterized protein (TIGR00725 family)